MLCLVSKVGRAAPVCIYVKIEQSLTCKLFLKSPFLVSLFITLFKLSVGCIFATDFHLQIKKTYSYSFFCKLRLGYNLRLWDDF